MSNSLRPHESQHVRPPCPSPTPGVYSNSRPSSWWCHPAISTSVVPFSSCPQSLPASGSFPMSQLIASGGQSTGVSASAWEMRIHHWQCQWEVKRGLTWWYRMIQDKFKAFIRNEDNIKRSGRMRIWSYFKENTFISAGNKCLDKASRLKDTNLRVKCLSDKTKTECWQKSRALRTKPMRICQRRNWRKKAKG